MEKKWITLEGFNCSNCGDDVEVFTNCIQEPDNEEFGTFVYDGDDVRCMAECGFKSHMIVYDEDCVGMDHEGNIEELEPNKR